MIGRGLVEVRREGPVATITLRREKKLNALSTDLERELMLAIDSAEVRESSVVVVAGSGRAFSAGADMEEMREATPAGILAYYRETGEVYERMAALPQPTVSAITGYCLGGGFELALATDFRIADETAVFGLPEVSIGIVPSSGGTHRLVRLVGPARAKELMLLRPRVQAHEAFQLGLVTEVVPSGRAQDRAREVAQQLAALPQLAASVAKQAASLMAEASREVGILIERLAYGTLAQSEDHREATRAFTEKRPPRFTGR